VRVGSCSSCSAGRGWKYASISSAVDTGDRNRDTKHGA
jgi:hypothetical protein